MSSSHDSRRSSVLCCCDATCQSHHQWQQRCNNEAGSQLKPTLVDRFGLPSPSNQGSPANNNHVVIDFFPHMAPSFLSLLGTTDVRYVLYWHILTIEFLGYPILSPNQVTSACCWRRWTWRSAFPSRQRTPNGGVLKKVAPQMDGLQWKILLKWMI